MLEKVSVEGKQVEKADELLRVWVVCVCVCLYIPFTCVEADGRAAEYHIH